MSTFDCRACFDSATNICAFHQMERKAQMAKQKEIEAHQDYLNSEWKRGRASDEADGAYNEHRITCTNILCGTCAGGALSPATKKKLKNVKIHTAKPTDTNPPINWVYPGGGYTWEDAQPHDYIRRVLDERVEDTVSMQEVWDSTAKAIEADRMVSITKNKKGSEPMTGNSDILDQIYQADKDYRAARGIKPFKPASAKEYATLHYKYQDLLAAIIELRDYAADQRLQIQELVHRRGAKVSGASAIATMKEMEEHCLAVLDEHDGE